MIARQQYPWNHPWLRLPTGKLSAAWNDRSLRVPVLVFAVLRIVTLLVAMLMIRDVSSGRPGLLWYDEARGIGNPSGSTYEASLPPLAPLASVMAPWQRYDTAWYILIAIQGYQPDTRIVFPPLYPILIHLLMPFVAGNLVLAAVLVSNIACLIAFILLYKWVLRQFGDQALATRTVILLAAFPTGFYLIAGYTESLFLALTLGAFLAALDRRWWLAGILAFLAALTRLQGAALCLPLAWIALCQDWHPDGRALLRARSLAEVRAALRLAPPNDRRALVRSWLARAPAVLAAPLGTLAFVGYLKLSQLGSMEAAYAVGWSLTTRMPWDSFLTYFERLQAGIVPPHEHNNVFALLLMFALGGVVLWRFGRVYALYVASTLFIILLRYHFGEGLAGAQFESAFRYVLMLFPCFAAAALLLRRRAWFIVSVLVMVQWQLFLLDNFIHWRWVA